MYPIAEQDLRNLDDSAEHGQFGQFNPVGGDLTERACLSEKGCSDDPIKGHPMEHSEEDMPETLVGMPGRRGNVIPNGIE